MSQPSFFKPLRLHLSDFLTFIAHTIRWSINTIFIDIIITIIIKSQQQDRKCNFLTALLNVYCCFCLLFIRLSRRINPEMTRRLGVQPGAVFCYIILPASHFLLLESQKLRSLLIPLPASRPSPPASTWAIRAFHVARRDFFALIALWNINLVSLLRQSARTGCGCNVTPRGWREAAWRDDCDGGGREGDISIIKPVLSFVVMLSYYSPSLISFSALQDPLSFTYTTANWTFLLSLT